MSLAFAVVMAAAIAGPSVKDFYPITPGFERTYEVHFNNNDGRQVETVGTPIRIEGKEVVPVANKMDGVELGTAYFGFEDETLFVMATNPRKLLATPIPILKAGTKPVKWEYLVDSPVLPIRKLTVKAVATPKGKKSVLGVQRETIEVTLLVETPKDAPVLFRSRQVIVYAAGVGPVDWDEESVMGKETRTKKMKLVGFKGPEPQS